MKTIFLLVALLLISIVAPAQKTPDYPSCLQHPGTQTDLNLCADQGLRQADADLNVVYKQLLAARSSDSAALEKLRASERAWIVYRDAFLEALYPAKDKQAQYGSMYPMQYAERRTELTREHIKALNSLKQAM